MHRCGNRLRGADRQAENVAVPSAICEKPLLRLPQRSLRRLKTSKSNRKKTMRIEQKKKKQANNRECPLSFSLAAPSRVLINNHKQCSLHTRICCIEHDAKYYNCTTILLCLSHENLKKKKKKICERLNSIDYYYYTKKCVH